MVRCTLLNGSAWIDIFFGVEHRMRKEEMEEQFKKEAKKGWRLAADSARIIDEKASSADRTHTWRGVFAAIQLHYVAHCTLCLLGSSCSRVVSRASHRHHQKNLYLHIETRLSLQTSARVHPNTVGREMDFRFNGCRFNVWCNGTRSNMQWMVGPFCSRSVTLWRKRPITEGESHTHLSCRLTIPSFFLLWYEGERYIYIYIYECGNTAVHLSLLKWRPTAKAEGVQEACTVMIRAWCNCHVYSTYLHGHLAAPQL